jgi:LmbE family N-acetylglucosaminyl deacetylase
MKKLFILILLALPLVVSAQERRKFLGACPDATETIKRRPGPTRIMIIGAHPDDADIVCGGFAVMQMERGCKVKFVSVTDGRMGHYRLSPEETARVRRAETLDAAKRFGLDGYDIYGYPDCGLVADMDARKLVAKKIREYEPDFVITHRTIDYHADHRATGQIVMDAGYLLGVPHWCEEVKAQRRRPVILYMRDKFTFPREIRPDMMFDVEPFLDRWCEGLDAQASQFYDWLPWDRGRLEEAQKLDRKDIAKRNAYLIRYTAGSKVYDAKRFAKQWKETYPDKPAPKYMEVFEVSEYGRAPTDADFKLLGL